MNDSLGHEHASLDLQRLIDRHGGTGKERGGVLRNTFQKTSSILSKRTS